MKADVGALLFIEDKLDATKKRPCMCVHVFKNTVGIPYNWLVVPITSKDSVGKDNLVAVEHKKLSNSVSYAKINNLESIAWNDEKIEVATVKFDTVYTQGVKDKLGELFRREKKE